MISIRRLLITTAALGGLMALTTTTGAVGPGYGPDSPSAKSIREAREAREASGSATGGETDTGSGCSKKEPGASGSGTGGAMDSGSQGATGSGAGGTTGSGTDDFGTGARTPGNGS